MATVDVYSSQDGGYQFIYIDGKFYSAIHYDDDLLGYPAYDLMRNLGHVVNELWHSDLSEEQVSNLNYEIDNEDWEEE